MKSLIESIKEEIEFVEFLGESNTNDEILAWLDDKNTQRQIKAMQKRVNDKMNYDSDPTKDCMGNKLEKGDVVIEFLQTGTGAMRHNIGVYCGVDQERNRPIVSAAALDGKNRKCTGAFNVHSSAIIKVFDEKKIE